QYSLEVAVRAAGRERRRRQDLVIHVGDYLYRQSACPPGDAGCAGSPYGDDWPTWKADFFAPAAPALLARRGSWYVAITKSASAREQAISACSMPRPPPRRRPAST